MNKLAYVLLASSIITITASAITINLDNLDDMIEQHLTDFRSVPTDNQEFISNENILAYTKIFIVQHFASQGKSFDQVPKIIKSKIFTACEQITKTLKKRLEKVKQTSINKMSIHALLKAALNQTFSELSTNIPANQITQTVHDNIATFFIDQGVTVAQIPTSMQQEFNERTIIIINNLNDLMDRSNQNFVTLADVQNAIQASLGAFIERMKNVLLWQWAIVQVSQIKGTPNQTPSSYLPPMDAESEKLYKSLKRLKN